MKAMILTIISSIEIDVIRSMVNVSIAGQSDKNNSAG